MADPKSLAVKLAHIYFHTGSWDKALVEYQKVLAIDPQDWNVHATIGQIHLKKGDWEKALEFLEKAAEGFLKDGQAKKAAGPLREIAAVIQREIEPQDTERAVKMYRRNLERHAESLENLTALRDLYHRHNQTEEAFELTVRLAELYNKQDYIDKAEKEYTRALEMKPDDPAIKEKLAALRRELS